MEQWEDAPEPGTKWIPLTNGQRVTVDSADFEFLTQWNWAAMKGKKRGTWYAMRWDSQRRFISLASVVIGIEPPLVADHVNHDTLDCRQSNLRPATFRQNIFNRSKRTGLTSKYKGVCWHKTKAKYICKIEVFDRSIHLGGFDSEDDAAQCYNDAATKHFGEFAFLNKIAGRCPSLDPAVLEE
jgi:hypothetical protein